MASTSPPAYGQTTLLEKLDLVPALSGVVGSALYATITGPFRGSEGATAYGDHVLRATFRRLMGRLNVAQLQFVIPPWIQSYTAYAKAQGFAPNIVDIPSSSSTNVSSIKGFWLGSPTAKTVLIYYHGGGFVMAGQPDYLKYLQRVLDSVTTAGKDLSVFLPSYTLAPQALHPTQLSQGVDALRYVLGQGRHRPSDVLLSGDSAGGNLALAVLSHLGHPHADVPRLELELGARLKGVVAISPWTSAALAYPSVAANAYKDVIPQEASHYWMSTYKGAEGLPRDPYTEAATADAGWWDGAKCESMIVSAGKEEILLGAIEEFVEKYKFHNKEITYVAGKGEAHDGPIFMGPTCDTAVAIDAWLKERL